MVRVCALVNVQTSYGHTVVFYVYRWLSTEDFCGFDDFGHHS